MRAYMINFRAARARSLATKTEAGNLYYAHLNAVVIVIESQAGAGRERRAYQPVLPSIFSRALERESDAARA